MKFLIFSAFSLLLVMKGNAQQPELQPLLSETTPINNGDEVILDCKVTNAGNDGLLVEWYHDGIVISFQKSLLRDENSAYTLEVGPDEDDSTTIHWIIRIANVNVLRDEGEWTCKFEGPPAKEVSTTLLQIGPPRIDYVTPNLMNPQPNSDVRLECRAFGSPLPSVTWSRTYPAEYILMNGARKGFVRNVFNSTIRLNPLSSDHRGEYMCSVTNGFGETLTRKTYVRLPYAPEVRATIRHIRVTQNSEAVLACISQAWPSTGRESNVLWTLNGTALDAQGGNVNVDRHPDGFYDERYYSRLTIRNVNYNHVGMYECIFTNEQGVGSAFVSLGLEPEIDPNFGAKSEL
ncbi:MAM domain-containing glycosylphosphatidylinositol anchor protein 2-like [Lytechinus pictus]|uniref:MAM domain-containing glycosylphosphatidylinositol anchor protein 2-like n=1 Tax=Lytechinus pictus TaxID=7653 RepID=UPI0030B9B514